MDGDNITIMLEKKAKIITNSQQSGRRSFISSIAFNYSCAELITYIHLHRLDRSIDRQINRLSSIYIPIYLTLFAAISLQYIPYPHAQ